MAAKREEGRIFRKVWGPAEGTRGACRGQSSVRVGPAAFRGGVGEGAG